MGAAPPRHTFFPPFSELCETNSIVKYAEAFLSFVEFQTKWADALFQV